MGGKMVNSVGMGTALWSKEVLKDGAFDVE